VAVATADPNTAAGRGRLYYNPGTTNCVRRSPSMNPAKLHPRPPATAHLPGVARGCGGGTSTRPAGAGAIALRPAAARPGDARDCCLDKLARGAPAGHDDTPGGIAQGLLNPPTVTLWSSCSGRGWGTPLPEEYKKRRQPLSLRHGVEYEEAVQGAAQHGKPNVCSIVVPRRCC